MGPWKHIKTWSRSVIGRDVIIEGKAYDEAFLVPMYQTREGLTLKLGKVVRLKSENGEGRTPASLSVLLQNERKAAVREIAVSLDLEEVTLTLVALTDLERIPKGTSFQAKLEDIDLCPESIWESPTYVRQVSNTGREMALNDLRIRYYPQHVRTSMRRHQIAGYMRDGIQEMLAGYSKTKEFDFGPADLSSDPKIFGLETATELEVDHHLEKHVDSASLLDVVLGAWWDVRPVAANTAFRVVLTLKVWIDPTELSLQMHVHAEQCDFPVRRDSVREYRGQFLAFSSRATSPSSELQNRSDYSRNEQLNWDEVVDSTLEVTDASERVIDVTLDESDAEEALSKEARPWQRSSVLRTINEEEEASSTMLDSKDIKASSSPKERLDKENIISEAPRAVKDLEIAGPSHSPLRL